jgi:hypothetical protein
MLPGFGGKVGSLGGEIGMFRQTPEEIGDEQPPASHLFLLLQSCRRVCCYFLSLKWTFQPARSQSIHDRKKNISAVRFDTDPSASFACHAMNF